MRQLALILFLVASLAHTTWAQTDDKRTVSTKIADLLAKLPAEDSKQLNANAAAVASLGEGGLLQLVQRLDAPGDNSLVHYAISGFSFAATEAGKEDWRSLAVKAYVSALGKTSNEESKLFIITQLEQIGKDDAVAALTPYLQHNRLSDAASRALATINSEASKAALAAALNGASGQAQLSILQALGDTRYQPAVKAIEPLATSSDPKLAKVALYALANIGDAGSSKILAAAAQKSGYTYDVTDAAASYIVYLNNLAAAGNVKEVETAANTILKKATANNQVHTRSAVLALLAAGGDEKASRLLTDALKDKNPEYREAALKFAAPLINESTAPLWLKTLSKAKPDVQSEIIRTLGNKGLTAALPVILQSFTSKDAAVRQAAISAAGKIGGTEVLPALLNVFKSGSADDISAAKTSLLSLKNRELTNNVVSSLTGASSTGKAALLEVLGDRGAYAKAGEVLSYASDADPLVRAAARKALTKIVTPANLPAVISGLNDAGSDKDVADWQQIAVTALGRIPDASKREMPLLSQMKNLSADQQLKYFNVLSGIGGSGKQGLSKVTAAFESGNEAAKKAAIAALANWKDGAATTEAYNILKKAANTPLEADAFAAFVKQINASEATGDLKLIMARNAMEYAKTNDQKKQVLSLVEKTKTYLGLLYAGRYLDDEGLKRQAANAVMNIALGDKNIYGNNVRALLEKAINGLGGSESEYQKEAIRKHLAAMPKDEGFVPLFNGKDLTGWKGLVADPVKRSKMDAKTLAQEQAKADEEMRKGWSVKDGVLIFNGHGNNLCTEKKYGDFEMFVDWKIEKDGDAGIYLRGTPQVQIWDTARVDVGAEVGSGGLYNNQKNPSKPLKLADNAIGDWNTFRIIMVGDLVTVYLNGELVVNGVPLENFWDRSQPIFPEEQIELQAHGTLVAYRDIYIREIPRPQPYVLTEEEKKEGFKILFDGTNLHEWVGNKTAYIIEDGALAVYPKRGGNGNLYTKDEYADFVFRFEFKLTPGANNGVGLRAPLTGDAAYEGMEIQVLDDDAPIYKDLQAYQYHGSVYGVIPAKRGYQKPVGEWNEEEIWIKGNKIRITLNGTVIVDGDLAEASKNGTLDKREHPGLKRTSGHIGFLGHGDILYFRNIRVKDLNQQPVKEAKKTTKKK